MRTIPKRTVVLGAILAVAALMMGALTPVSASMRGVDKQPVELEFDDGGEFTDGSAVLGRSKLTRRAGGLKATVDVEGLRPGGVFTFWWVVPQRAGAFPSDIFVARGAGQVIGSNGKATVRMSADVGDPGIDGFPVLEGAQFSSLDDPLGSTVRIEVAYHGQATDAGGDLDQWLSDFWSGSACPNPPDVNAAGQPHCPVYIAATHLA